jgi:hypothetical protein
VRIIASAREHGISDEDMLHAVRVPLRVIDLDEETTLYIGAGLNGALLEVVVADLETEDPRIIHAMALREKFHRYL